ncbi:MAG TPA: phage Gp37/Gp68 family protein [Verrucomicrobiae bacterium]|nr:phage Gp37/Gp68 family protein [Verrucomicrobiae bacterium]
MSTISSIEWTERTWNPVVGCHKISQGCKNCYAEVMSRRLRAMGSSAYQQPFTKVRLLPERLAEPLQVRKPAMWFVNSMSDLFQKDVPDAFIAKTFETMREASWHTFQVLTKRPARMARYFSEHAAPSTNVWLGTSVENKKQGLPRIAELAKIKANIRFLSIEPLLEDVGSIDLSGIHWVIVGGESGPQARPIKIEWIRSIYKQCRAQRVAFFFKQWGAWGADGIRRSKGANGRQFKGRTWNEMPVPV